MIQPLYNDDNILKAQNNGSSRMVEIPAAYAWINGTGSVAVDGLMEDLATVEISRTQLWQWRYHGLIGDNQWRNILVGICQDNQIAMDAPVVGYIEKLLDTNVFYDFASTAIQGWKAKL